MKRIVGGLALLAIGALSLAACASGADGGSGSSGGADQVEFEKKSPLSIGYTAMDLSDPYFQRYAAGIESAAAEYDAEVIVVDARASQQTQVSGSADLINQGVSALIVSPIQPDALPATVDAAHEAKIPVIIGDVGAAGDYDAYILSDNADGGTQAAEYFKTAFGDEEVQVGVLELQAGIVVGEDRVNGFLDGIADSPNIQVASQLVGQNVEDSFKAAQDMLTANPDLRAIYAANGPSAEGAARALEAAGISIGDEFVLLGFNGDPVELELIGEGKQSATIAQDPFEQGRMAVEVAMGLLDGEEPAFTDPSTRTINVPVSLVDESNLAEFQKKLDEEG